MEYKILAKVDSPDDLKSLTDDEISLLTEELRAFLMEKVQKTGGHLASNLGVVEVTVALHRVFDSPKDHIIFDVGHQSYVHKILTGRKNDFDSLRKTGGLSGFTSMKESEHDAFGAGHSSTSVSSALGYAETDKLSGSDSYTVALIGDGAYTGGMVHEALNNCKPELRLIIVLNENGMSISTNKGAFASYLSRVRVSKGYQEMKESTSSILDRIKFVGKPIKTSLSFIKKMLKKAFFKTSYFEDLGLYYIGPIDGNDYKKVERALKEAKRLAKCVVVHIKTMKGKGLDEAERSPETYHSLSSGKTESTSFHSEMAKELCNIAKVDPRVVAVTAAMGQGTGLSAFADEYPDRYFDVGIAEEHAVTFSAGIAANGYKPYVAIYSTFLQRAYDNVIHDVALQNLPVRMLIDRASIALKDGATHHGIFDVAFLCHIPNMTVISPATYGSLNYALRDSLSSDAPIAIRYPNASEPCGVRETFYPCEDYENYGIRCSFNPELAPKNIFVTYGSAVGGVLRAKEILSSDGIECGIVLVERIKPFDKTVELLHKVINKGTHIVYVEEGIKNGGAGMITRDYLASLKLPEYTYEIVAIDDEFASPKEEVSIYDYLGLSGEKLALKFKD